MRFPKIKLKSLQLQVAYAFINHEVKSYNTDLTFAFYQRGFFQKLHALIREATLMHGLKPTMALCVMFILRMFF